MHVVVDDLRVETLYVFRHLRHQFRALQFGMAAGPVFHLRSGGQLAAHFYAGDQRRPEVGACGI